VGDGEALTVTVGEASGWGRVTGAGPLFRKMNAAGTMISPAMTVTTKETAPHSFRISCPKSTIADSTGQVDARRSQQKPDGRKRELQLDLSAFLLVPLVQEPDEILRAGEGLPALREEVLRQDVPGRELIDGDAPLLKGACDLHLEIIFSGGIAHDLVVVVKPSSS
jgi:hypothetical protein